MSKFNSLFVLCREMLDFRLLIQSMSFVLFRLCQQMFCLPLQFGTVNWIHSFCCCLLSQSADISGLKQRECLFKEQPTVILFELYFILCIWQTQVDKDLHIIAFYFVCVLLMSQHVHTCLSVGRRGISLTCVLTPCRVIGVCVVLMTLGAIGAAVWAVGQNTYEQKHTLLSEIW